MIPNPSEIRADLEIQRLTGPPPLDRSLMPLEERLAALEKEVHWLRGCVKFLLEEYKSSLDD